MSFFRSWPRKSPPVAVGAAVLPLKTLLARPRLDQRAIDREVLVGHQALRALDDPPEEAARDLLIQQAGRDSCVNTVGAQIGSSMSIPTNHRNSRL